MKRLLTPLLLAVSTLVSAGLPTSGLPSGNPEIALHVSNETVDKTQIGKALTGAFQGEIDANEVVITLKDLFGFSLDEDFRDLTAVAKLGDKGSLSEFTALVRGNFDKVRIESFAAKQGVPSRSVQGQKAWDLQKLVDAVIKATNSKDLQDSTANERQRQQPGYVVILDGSTVLLSTATTLERDIAAAKTNAPWSVAGLKEADASVKNGWLLVSANVAAIEAAEKARSPESTNAKSSGLKTVILAIGESPSDLQVRVQANCVDDATSKKYTAQAKGMLGFGSMMLMPGEKDTPEQASAKSDGVDLIQRIKITQDGSKIDATLDYPVQKLAALIVKAAKTRRDKAATGVK